MMSTGAFCIFTGLLLFLFLAESPASMYHYEYHYDTETPTTGSFDPLLDGDDSTYGIVGSERSAPLSNAARQARESNLQADIEHLNNTDDDEELDAIGFFEAWRIPGVVQYSTSYAGLKLVNYAMFFWLPFYLSKTIYLHQAGATAKSNQLSANYDLGQICGAFFAGASCFYARAHVLIVMKVRLRLSTPDSHYPNPYLSTQPPRTRE